MNDDLNIVLEKEKKRYQILLELWREAEGSENKEINFDEIVKKEGYSKSESDELYIYFHKEGFFRNATFGGNIHLSHLAVKEIERLIYLSHLAVKEIEKSIKHPSQSTEHFSATIIQNFNAQVSNVQTGNNNLANINQSSGGDLSEILDELTHWKTLLNSLQVTEREEAIEVVDALAEELQKETPSKGRLKAFLIVTKDFVVKVGVDFAASATAKILENQMGIK